MKLLCFFIIARLTWFFWPTIASLVRFEILLIRHKKILRRMRKSRNPIQLAFHDYEARACERDMREEIERL